MQPPRHWLSPEAAAARPDPRHYDVLREGPGIWNQWRELYPEVAIDLRGAVADSGFLDISHLNAAGRDTLSRILGDVIRDSLVERPEAVPVTDAQRKELARRRRAHARNPSAAKPWAEVRARLRRRK